MGGGGFLGLGPAPSAPAAPDYSAAATATASGNLDAARAATAANRVNQVTPYGNLDYTISGQDSYGNPTWTAKTSLSDVGQQLLNAQNNASLGLGSAINSQLGNVNRTMGEPFNPQTNPVTTTAGQANLNQLTGSSNLNQLTGNADLSQVGQGPQFNQAGTAQQAQGVGSAQQAYGIGSGQQAQGMGQAQNLLTDTNYASGMQGWDKANQILQARLQPQMEQAREAQASQLVNQGIPVGSKAYENAMRTFNQGQNDLLTNSQLAGQSIGNNLFNQGLAGGQFTNAAITQQNQNQLANTGLSNAAIAQNFGQNLQAQQLQNQAAQQNYSNQIAGTQLGNQAAQQNYGNQLAGLQFNNQTGQQGYANQLAQIQANNAANQQGYANSQQQQQANNALAQQYYANQQAQQQANNAIGQQQFGNQLANANLGNAAQQQQYNQAMTNYNMPLNTLSALRSGAQVQNPTFQNAPQQATTAGADLLGASQMGYNAQMGGFNAANAAQSNFNSGLMGLGGTLGAAAIMSDIRTKENIKPIGWLPNGLPVYEYEYKPEWKAEAGHGKFIGVMAQEVEQVMPEAVITRPDGYKMVNYGVLNG